MLELGATQAKKTTSPHIREADTGNFEEAVITASLKTPVIVDFWAPWCQPCKAMMPHLEKAIENANGAVTLVKINVEKYPELAEVFRVQSVPTVYAFYQGQPVDGFVGGKNESEVNAFVGKLVKQYGGPAVQGMVDREAVAKVMAEADKFFADGQLTDAMASYSTALDMDEKNMDALAGIGWCFVAQKDMESLKEFMSQMTPEQMAFARIRGLGAILARAGEAETLDSIDNLQSHLEKTPKDLQARYDLALRCVAACDIEGAIDALVELTRRDREWQDQKARKLLLGLFDALGPSHPLAAQGRRRLSSVLFS